jgi:hypothetical protein
MAAGCLCCAQTPAQQWRLPEPVTNQSTALLNKGGRPMVYTFYGLDSTLRQEGIHRKVFRLDLGTLEARPIGLVPDTAGRLASSATVIRNKAYICGGYSVSPSGKERSSPFLFIFNPESESFTKGAKLPVPIDDQVQCAWRDSLLFVLSGWNDSTNVRTVQVYDPGMDRWSLGTPLPAERDAAVFGGCGTIVGDTIYLLGGAVYDKFYPPSGSLYKGYIDPVHPTNIRWLPGIPFPGERRYRSVAWSEGGKVYFAGGSSVTYNYNGIGYKDKKPVSPNETLLVYDIATGALDTRKAPRRVMDLRNGVSLDKDHFIIVGGIGPGLQVSDQVLKFVY